MTYFNTQIQERPLCGKKRTLSGISNRVINKSCDTVKQKRRVHFSKSSNDDITIRTTQGPSYKGTSSSDIWYTRRELAIFTKLARDHVLGFSHPYDNETKRGYERYDIARMQQKAMTRKVILLLTQQKVLSDEEKSIIANRSSAWAVEEAFEMGCMDFCEAYHPQLTHILQQPRQEEHAIIAYNLQQQQQPQQQQQQQQQNKRRRLNAPNQNFTHHEVFSRAA